jgi:hypothetical protein
MKHYGCLIFVLAFLALLAALVGFFLTNPESVGIPTSAGIKQVRIAGQDVKVELALSKEEQARGLSGREGLAEDEGLLFIFAKPGKYSFWMKDMKFPIDIIWLASAGGEGGKGTRVIFLIENAQPESLPESFASDMDARYVLEVSAGFAEKNNLRVGDAAEFVY